MATDLTDLPEGTVTVLFTDMVGSTELNQRLGDDDAHALSRSLETMARELVETNRGIPVKGLGDGIMAVFTSARRAVTCAQAIQREMATSTASIRIGLHTGEVITDEGDVHGETVIIAKRIEGLAAPGTIWASQTVHGVLGTARSALTDLGTHQLKGIDADWQLFEVPTVDAADDRPTVFPLVGRSAELAQLIAIVASARRGAGRLVLVSGEAGVGKSRLVAEVLGSIDDVRVLGGQCLDMQPPPPFQPLIDQLDAVIRTTTPERLRALLGENAAEVATLVPSLRQRYDDLPTAPSMPLAQERQYVLRGVADVIERGANLQPLILLFEDIHWADESTILLLRTLLPRLARLPLVVVATHRPLAGDRTSPLSAGLPDLARHESSVTVDLTPLSRDQVAAVLADRAGSAPPAHLVDLVLGETGGNPFFVEELYRHLKDNGKLVATDGRWLDDIEIAENEVPKGVLLLVGRRLDGLTTAARRHLATAAVIGRQFSFDLLEALSSTESDALFDSLEAAERLGLVDEVADRREAGYRFSHELVRQSLLTELSLARRQRLHLRIGAEISERGQGTAIEIAHHLDLAGAAAADDDAAQAHLTAAREALASVAFEDAIVQVNRALDRLDEHPVSMAEALAVRAQCERGLGLVDAALATFAEAIALVPTEHDSSFEIRSQRIALLLEAFRGAEALAEVKLLSTHPRADNPPDRPDVELLRARALYILSLDDRRHGEAARASYERAYEAAVALGDNRRAIRALLPTVWFRDYWPEYVETAYRNVAEARRLAATLSEDDDLVLDVDLTEYSVFSTDAIFHLSEESRERFRTLAESNDEMGEALLQKLERRRDPLRLKEHCFSLMWRTHGRSMFETGVRVCDRGIELAAQLGVPPVQYGSIKAIHLTELGRYDEIEEAIASEVTDGENHFGRAMATFARAAFLMGVEAWEPALETALRGATEMGQVNRGNFRALLASMAVVAGANCSALATARDALDRDDFARALHQRRVHLAILDGDHEFAATTAERTVDTLEAYGLLTDRNHVRALWAMAEHQRGGVDAVGRVTADALADLDARPHPALEWKFRALRGHALHSLGDADGGNRELARARGQFAALSARLHDPELRTWFGRQPIAALL